MIEKIKQNVGVVALVVAILALGFSLLYRGTVRETVREIQTKFGSATGYDNINYQNASGSINDGTVDQVTLNLGTGTDTAPLLNDSGATVFLDDAWIATSGTASSSFRYYLLATSTPYVPNTVDFSNLTNNTSLLLVKGTVATSTTATTTSSVITAIRGSGEGVLAIPNQWYVILYLQTADANCFSLPAGAGCEQSTSTNRGIDPKATMRAYSTSTTVKLRTPY